MEAAVKRVVAEHSKLDKPISLKAVREEAEKILGTSLLDKKEELKELINKCLQEEEEENQSEEDIVVQEEKVPEEKKPSPKEEKKQTEKKKKEKKEEKKEEPKKRTKEVKKDSESEEDSDDDDNNKLKKPKYTPSTEQSFVRVGEDLQIHFSDKKRITLNKFRGRKYLHLREYYNDKPTKKGISFSEEEWSKVKSLIGTIDEMFNKV
ncbi:hypothetical protein ABK040_004537 [Willaertia magna]